VLLEAKNKNFIKVISPYLDSLRQIAGFRIGDPLYRYALKLADEKS
jgi:predicted nucleic acid-binding protein